MYIKHPELIEPITRAFQAVEKGKNEKALEIIKAVGLPEPEAELQVIIDFVDFMKNKFV